MLYDFHTHTYLSDGALSPVEQIRRALVNRYAVIGLTDHAGLGDCDEMLRQLTEACAICEKYWGIVALPGVELTHLPPEAIPEAARYARDRGARIIVVHGETVIEPVPAGTNHAAVQCPDVDILAHPGLLALEDAQLAAANGVFIEISARPGHAFANGHVVKVGRQAMVRFVVDSDAHEPEDLLTEDFARQVALGAGLSPEEANEVLQGNPRQLLRRIQERTHATTH